jgi:DNA-binding CsgD family transcriptional regulator
MKLSREQQKLFTKKQIAQLRAQGLTWVEIGKKLNISDHIIYYHFHNVKSRKNINPIKQAQQVRKEKIQKVLKQRHSQQRIGKSATKEVLQKLRTKGLTYSEIAIKLKMPQNNVYYYMNKYNLTKHHNHVENNNIQ